MDSLRTNTACAAFRWPRRQASLATLFWQFFCATTPSTGNGAAWLTFPFRTQWYKAVMIENIYIYIKKLHNAKHQNKTYHLTWLVSLTHTLHPEKKASFIAWQSAEPAKIWPGSWVTRQTGIEKAYLCSSFILSSHASGEVSCKNRRFVPAMSFSFVWGCKPCQSISRTSPWCQVELQLPYNSI